MNKGKIGTCRFCHQLKHLLGGGTYCTTCYRKFVRPKQECKRCHQLKIITANGYCGSCYNYIMGYHEKGRVKVSAAIKRRIKPQKCFFCQEKRPEMLEAYRKKETGGDDDIKNFVLLCPNHYREVYLGIKSL